MTTHPPFGGGAFRVTSAYGPRPSLGDYHNGIDLVGLDGDFSVCAVMGGTVRQSRIVTNKSDRTWEWGNYVSVLQDDGMTAFYCHLASRTVKKGARVEAGDEIGVMGDTGYTLGPHLHFEIRNGQNIPFDPAGYLGIPNEPGAIIEVPVTPKPSDEELVVSMCGFEKQTRDHINKYRWGFFVWQKIAGVIRGLIDHIAELEKRIEDLEKGEDS